MSDAPHRSFATRRFRTPEGREIVAQLCAPSQCGDDDWVCEFRVTGLGADRVGYGYGVDGIQAVLLALDGLRTTMEGLESFEWDAGVANDCGIPRMLPTSYGHAFRKHLGDLIDGEIAKLVKGR